MTVFEVLNSLTVSVDAVGAGRGRTIDGLEVLAVAAMFAHELAGFAGRVGRDGGDGAGAADFVSRRAMESSIRAIDDRIDFMDSTRAVIIPNKLSAMTTLPIASRFLEQSRRTARSRSSKDGAVEGDGVAAGWPSTSISRLALALSGGRVLKGGVMSF